MILSFDTETTGVDFWHGSRVFFVSMCDENDNQYHWRWDVDPFTREVTVPPADVAEIRGIVDRADAIVGHNVKFDVHALRFADPVAFAEWPWEKTHDTMVAAHLLGSNQLKDLTTLGVRYLGVDISRFETDLEHAVKRARHVVESKAFVEERGEWATGHADRPDMPSAKGGSPWRTDYWLPFALWERYTDLAKEHPEWATVLETYGNADTAMTVRLWQAMESELRRLDVWEHYLSRMRTLPVLTRMERLGVTVIRENLDALEASYVRSSASLGAECLAVARKRGADLVLPKTGANGSLKAFVFGNLKLPPVHSKKSKTGEPSLDKNALAHYDSTLPEGDALRFVRALRRKRKVDTSISYIQSYRRFGIDEGNGIMRLHPSINPTGTTVTRRSSSNPNEQNISDQRDEDGHSLRSAFGPAPGREWYSLDFENLELRIPAYEAGETAMIDLFERPDDPPYFGSNHLLAAHILWPAEFEETQTESAGWSFKEKYKLLYKRTKNGNFAVQYGAMEQSGTADRAYGQAGAQRKIQERLGRIATLNRSMIDHANRHGYVYTMPERDVSAAKGFPIMCTRSDFGGVTPTTPLSYHIQGTAGRVAEKALQRCQRQLDEWNRRAKCPDLYRIAIEVHDEIVFDFPAGRARNAEKINIIKGLMERSGDDIGVPLKVDVSYHPNNWAEEG